MKLLSNFILLALMAVLFTPATFAEEDCDRQHGDVRTEGKDIDGTQTTGDGETDPNSTSN